MRELSGGLDLTGRIVTMDAMHALHETARCLLGRRADYVVSAVKDNQETILEDLKAIDFSDAAWHETVDKGHGRIERRRCAVVDLSAAEWDGYANLHGRRQAMCIEREREILKTGKRSIEVTWSLTSLGAERAGPEELLDLVRSKRYRAPILPADLISGLTLRLDHEPHRRDRDDRFDFGIWRRCRCCFG